MTTTTNHNNYNNNNSNHKEKNFPTNNVTDSASGWYTCDICGQSFSRSASLTSHQAHHYESMVGDCDGDVDDDYNEDRVFFGQKLKKKRRVPKKVLQDQYGNYI